MKYWLIWLFGFLTGMYVMWSMIINNSVLLSYRGIITDIIAILSCIMSVILNITVFINALALSWELFEDRK